MPQAYSVALALAVIIIVLAVALYTTLRVRTEGDGEQKTKAPPLKYRVTIFDSGEQTKSFLASQVSSAEGRGFARQPGHKDWSLFSGTYVIEPEKSDTETPRTSACKWHVQLFCGNKVVREWYATRVSSGEAKLFVLPEGATEWTIVGGTFFAEPSVTP